MFSISSVSTFVKKVTASKTIQINQNVTKSKNNTKSNKHEE